VTLVAALSFSAPAWASDAGAEAGSDAALVDASTDAPPADAGSEAEVGDAGTDASDASDAADAAVVPEESLPACDCRIGRPERSDAGTAGSFLTALALLTATRRARRGASWKNRS